MNTATRDDPGMSPQNPFDVLRAAFLVLDAEGVVAAWSFQAQQLLGFPADEVVGRQAVELLVSPQERGAVAEAARAALREGGWAGVLTLRDRAGRPTPMGLRARSVSREDGGPEWWVMGAPAEEVAGWETDQALLAGLLDRSPVGLLVQDAELRALSVNARLAGTSGIPADQWRGRRAADVLRETDAETLESRLRRVLETGQSPAPFEHECRLRSEPSRERVLSVSAFRVEDPGGQPLGVAATLQDVTQYARARRRLGLLAKVGSKIGTRLDVGQTARELAHAAVPDLADCVSVDLLPPVLSGTEPDRATEPAGRDGASLVRAALQSVYPDPELTMNAVGATVRFSADSPHVRALRRRQPVLERELSYLPGWISLRPEQEKRAVSLGIHSLMVVPLMARGMVLGLLSLWRSHRQEPFEEGDLVLAAEFASAAALSIDNARRYTFERQAAMALQRSLLPHRLGSQAAVEVAFRYLPAGSGSGVGGDWFDVIPLSGARVALVVGDVVGRGIHAAATMGRLRTAVQTLAALDLEPDEVLSHLDDLVNRLAEEPAPAPGDRTGEEIIGATCLYAVYDPVARSCTVARAGHLPPVLVESDGEARLTAMPDGPPLGLGGLPFEIAEFEVGEGSLLVLYTDGLVAGPKLDTEAGLKRLRVALDRPQRPLEEICGAVLDAVLVDRPAVDDVTLVVARTRALGPDRVATWELEAEPTAASAARKLVAERLGDWGMDDLVFTTELVASELISNVLRYASGPLTLRLIRDDRLICEVSDRSHTAPHLRRAHSTDEGGRGLFLVAQLTARWGTRYSRDGKTVWTEQTLPAD